MKRQSTTKKRKAFLFIAIVIILAPFLYGATISGWHQLVYGGDFSLNASSLNFYTANTSRFFISNDGLLGMGTTAPAARLHLLVQDTNNFSTTDLLILEHTLANPLNSTGGMGVGILFRGMDNGSNTDTIALINATLVSAMNGSESSSLGFYTRTNGGALSPALSINGSNVGIGTISPTEKLAVIGNFSTTQSNNTLGNFTISQYNSSCAGFRFGQSGGWILSCA